MLSVSIHSFFAVIKIGGHSGVPRRGGGVAIAILWPLARAVTPLHNLAKITGGKNGTYCKWGTRDCSLWMIAPLVLRTWKANLRLGGASKGVGVRVDSGVNCKRHQLPLMLLGMSLFPYLPQAS